MNDFNELIVVRVLISRQQSAPSVATLLQIQSLQCTSLAAQKKRVWTYRSCQKRLIGHHISFLTSPFCWCWTFHSRCFPWSRSCPLTTRICIPFPYHPYTHYSLSLSSLLPIPIIRIHIIPYPYNPDAIMICFQSKLHFNTYRLEKAGRTWIIIFLDVCSQTLKVVFFTA